MGTGCYGQVLGQKYMYNAGSAKLYDQQGHHIRHGGTLQPCKGSSTKSLGRVHIWIYSKSDISSHLLSKVPQDINNQDPNPSLTWSAPGASREFKVKCNSSELARWLCVKLLGLSVKQGMCLGSIAFKSTKILPMQSDWHQHFNQLSILDVSTEFQELWQHKQCWKHLSQIIGGRC